MPGRRLLWRVFAVVALAVAGLLLRGRLPLFSPFVRNAIGAYGLSLLFSGVISLACRSFRVLLWLGGMIVAGAGLLVPLVIGTVGPEDRTPLLVLGVFPFAWFGVVLLAGGLIRWVLVSGTKEWSLGAGTRGPRRARRL